MPRNKVREWIDGTITKCDVCGFQFYEGCTMYDAVVLHSGGTWGYLCCECQKFKTMAGHMDKEEAWNCRKFVYKPYIKN